MDPRHPELAVARMRELLNRYDRIEKDIRAATTTSELGRLEREGGLVVQEMCLVAPRVHEAMMQTSRNRRRDMRDPNKMDFPFKLEKITPEMADDHMRKVEEAFAEKPKKKTSKKKKAEE